MYRPEEKHMALTSVQMSTTHMETGDYDLNAGTVPFVNMVGETFALRVEQVTTHLDIVNVWWNDNMVNYARTGNFAKHMNRYTTSKGVRYVELLLGHIVNLENQDMGHPERLEEWHRLLSLWLNIKEYWLVFDYEHENCFDCHYMR